MKPLWIVGGAGAALEVWAVARALQRPVAGFVVRAGEPPGFDPEGLAVEDEGRFLARARNGDFGELEVALAIGQPAARQRAARPFESAGLELATLVHPRAVLGPAVSLGPGTVVMAAAVLETHVRVGRANLINVAATLAHECALGDFTSVGPGVHLAGRVRIGARCDLGVGAVARPGVRLGDDVVVGAGAVLVGDFDGPVQLTGVPARAR